MMRIFKFYKNYLKDEKLYENSESMFPKEKYHLIHFQFQLYHR